MNIEIELPHIGESVTEAVIEKWLKNINDDVEKYEPLLEIITDKVSMEIPSPYNGKLIKTLVSEGETVDMGKVIAVMDISDADYIDKNISGSIPDDTIIGSFSDAANVGPTGGEFNDTSIILPNEKNEDFIVIDNKSDNSDKYSPAVLRLAYKHNLDLNDVVGTGNKGRISKIDVINHIQRADQIKSSDNLGLNISDDDEITEPTILRKIIATRMKKSFSEIPHAWTSIEVDMTNIKKIINLNKEKISSEHNAKLTYLPFCANAVSKALKEHRHLNSTWLDGKIILRKDVNLGIAMAGEGGLVVPVIKKSDNFNVLELCIKISDLTKKARTSKLHLEDLESGTFTLNNTGALGSVIGGAIINYPQAAIITTESVVDRAVVRKVNGKEIIAIGSIMNLCLSFDHRIIDGLDASNFVQSVKKSLESITYDSKII